MASQEAAVKMILFYCVVTFSVFPNAIVIFTVPKTERDMKIHDMLLVSLAVSDSVRAILGHLPEVATTHGQLVLKDGQASTCTWSGFFICFLSYVSVTHMMTLPLEQLLHILHPAHWSRILQSSRLKGLLIVFIWCYGLMFAIPPVLGVSSYRIEAGVCSLYWEDPYIAGKTFILSLFVLMYLVPITVIFVSFCQIRRELKSMKSIADKLFHQKNYALLKKYKVQKRHTLLVLTMICSFFVLWTPYACVAIMMVLKVQMTYTQGWVSAFLGKSTVLMNPLLYLFLKGSYKSKLLRLLRRRSKVAPEVFIDGSYVEDFKRSPTITEASWVSHTRTWTI